MTPEFSSQERRVLIVAPHFAPISAPDGQRVRMLVRHLPELGWRSHVLSVDSTAAEAPLEPELADTLASDLPVTRVSAWPARLTRQVGLGNVAWRAWSALRRAGDRLLREQRFDLVYFSTTQFACLPLGRVWLRRHGVPFVIDLQDPWRTDYVHAPGTRPPGGWKYRWASTQARWLEPWTLRRCAGVIAVSPAYGEQLSARYPWWDHKRFRTIPMGWSDHDLTVARSRTASSVIDPSLIRYIGRLGTDMAESLNSFLTGFALARRNPAGAVSRLHAQFRGGSYDPSASAGPVKLAAASLGFSDAIDENPARLPYLASLAQLLSAGANLILGSDDSGYAPSKIWLTLAARRPWLAIARRRSVLHELLAPHAGSAGWLVDPTDPEAATRIASFCQQLHTFEIGSVNEPILANFEARELAAEHTEFFDRMIGRR